MPSAAERSESMRRLAPSPVVVDTSPSAANAFSRPYATPDKELVKSFRRSSAHKPSGQLRRPTAGAQQLKPLPRAGRQSPWPQQIDRQGVVDRSKIDRAKQRRRRGGNHVCICRICGQRTQQPAAASAQLARLETKWKEIRDHAVWKDAGYSGPALHALERQLDKIRRQMVVMNKTGNEVATATQVAPATGPEAEPEPELEQTTVTKDMRSTSPNDHSANESVDAGTTQMQGDHQQITLDVTDPEKLVAAAEGGNPDDIVELIEAGADFNVASEVNGLAGIDRCLVLAAVRGHDAAVQVLLNAGANSTATQNGITVLELVQKRYRAAARSPPGPGADDIETLSMAAHRDLLEGLQATEQILMTASKPQ